MTDAPHDPGERFAESTRVEAFSDGAFAIALTLLVLDLHAPDARGQFLPALLDQWPGYLAYLAAFLNISAIWINRHDLFARIRRVDAAPGRARSGRRSSRAWSTPRAPPYRSPRCGTAASATPAHRPVARPSARQ